MKATIIFIIVFIIHSNLFAQETRDQCYNCHSALGDKASSGYSNDIHFKKGISCASCHGGNSKSDDMSVSMSKASGFKGIPKGNVKSEACINCHSSSEKMLSFGSKLGINQAELLSRSVHGKSSIRGNERIIQCIDCHGVHGILPANDRRSNVHPLNIPKNCAKCHNSTVFMRSYNPALPVDQLEKYLTSEHGKLNRKGDPKVAECASCHGSHDILSASDVRSRVHPTNIPKTCSKCHSDINYMQRYKIPTDQYEKFAKSVHGKALLEKKDASAPACNNCHGNHGAIPPGIESISKVCGSCHALNADLFASSPHKKIFDEKRIPECESCHGNHYIETATNKLLGVSSESVCSKCHTEKESVKGYQVAKTMRSLIDSLDYALKYAGSLISEAEQKGMEIADAKFKLRDANQAKLEAKTMVHSFDEAKFREVVEGKGFAVTTFVIGEGNAAIDNYYFRRYGLVIFILIISFLSIVLYIYIKRLDKKHLKT
ncbi:MAG: cytochrome c3 family protein [Bacteroidetes bacterium]|nr:cytochrome c3 family protein [Bacteroidota bacterium]